MVDDGASGTAPAERVRIDSNGNMGIRTTAPSQKLHVNGNVRAQGTVNDCTIGNGSGGTNFSSDSSLKENIKLIENALGKILRLSGVEFDWNEKGRMPGRHDIGVIAQEVQKVFPTVVMTDDDSGYMKVDYAGLVSPLIQSTKKIYEMCKASDSQLKSLEAKVLAHDRRIASVESDIVNLKSRNQSLETENQKLKAKLQQNDLDMIKKKLGLGGAQ